MFLISVIFHFIVGIHPRFRSLESLIQNKIRTSWRWSISCNRIFEILEMLLLTGSSRLNAFTTFPNIEALLIMSSVSTALKICSITFLIVMVSNDSTVNQMYIVNKAV